MQKEFTSVEKRAVSPQYFIMFAHELKTIKPFPPSHDFNYKEEPSLSVFEVEYKHLKGRVHKALIAAARGGLNCTTITVDEELSEELIKHLHHIGYFVVSGPIVDGTIKILINW